MSTKKEPKELAKQFYTVIYRMHHFKKEVPEFYKRGLMSGLACLYLGEEAVAAGAYVALREDDYIDSTHRSHSHLMARGADLDQIMAEILGKKTGYLKGKGDSMHIMAMDKDILGANGIAGDEIPIVTGAAYSTKFQGVEQVTLAFFGNSASNEGTFHESINMAVAWNLPIVYIIENNLFGIPVDIRRVTKEHDLYKRAEGYGILGEAVDGNDVYAVCEAVSRAVERVRKGEESTFIECKTCRWQGHRVGDPDEYRAPEELAIWKAREPLAVR